MAYGVKYQTTFDRIDKAGVAIGYTLQILQKGYSGVITDVIAAGVPVVHSYQTDEPKAPIKGSSLSITLINQNGALPLETFYSVDDDEYQVQFFWETQLMFIGYLVQDDFNEILNDFTHEIVLSANDNLGLLKDVALDKAKVTYDIIAQTNDTWSATAPNTITIPVGIAASVQNGDIIKIESLIFNATYTVIDNSGSPNFIVAETVTTFTTGTSDDIIIERPSQFPDLISIATVINNCLAATDLQINTNVFCNFKEASQDLTKCFITEILLNSQTFLKDAQTYNNCYYILEGLMKRFNCTLFQAKGVWNIVHWDELRYDGYEVPGFAYDSDFNLLGAIFLNEKSMIFAGYDIFQVGIGENTLAQAGLNHRLFRPYNFDMETFNFRQPLQILRNFDLQTLGNLINTFTTGSGPSLKTFNDYTVTWWVTSTRLDAGNGTFFVRVTLDSIGNEIDRFLVVTRDVKSYKIEVAKGDIFKYSFTFRTEDSQPGPITLQIYIELTDGTTTNYYHNDGTWSTGVGWGYDIPTGDNSNQWHSVTIDNSILPGTSEIPFDGLLYCYLRVADLSGTVHGTYYKDIRFDYTPLINESTKITGQTHKNSQVPQPKNNENLEIIVDDSPRNSVAGTLFLSSMTGVLQDRTVQWFLNDPSTPEKLGNLTTFEVLYWRRIVRSILEGTYCGLVSADSGGNHISMLGVFNYTFFPGLNYIFGKLDIDYKNNHCTGTLSEIFDDGEVDSDLAATYIFNYLYAPK